MQITSLLSHNEPPDRDPSRKQKHDHDHDHDHPHDHDHSDDAECSSCGHDHEHTPVHLRQTIVGLLFILNSFFVGWFFKQANMVADISAMIGAIILGYPIVLTSFKDLKKGILSINELVGIAVLAAFASGAFGQEGGYQKAGLVAFFMLFGEIIETRTAAGARASIESLIKLTPTKARRMRKDGTEEEVPVKDLAIGDVI